MKGLLESDQISVLQSYKCSDYGAGFNGWVLLTLGIVMPSYALRYVFFGTRWGANSSFAMVNTIFTSLCPARILLPCPDGDPVSCHLTYPKMYQQHENSASSSAHFRKAQQVEFRNPQIQQSTAEMNFSNNTGSLNLFSESDTWPQTSHCPYSHQGVVSLASDTASNTTQVVGHVQHAKQDRADLHFPVLVPLWQIYVRERPLPIYLHTIFMTVAALLWPLQVSLLPPYFKCCKHVPLCIAAALYLLIVHESCQLSCFMRVSIDTFPGSCNVTSHCHSLSIRSVAPSTSLSSMRCDCLWSCSCGNNSGRRTTGGTAAWGMWP